jgi:hypothetical protein
LDAATADLLSVDMADVLLHSSAVDQTEVLLGYAANG